ncbi:MAG: sulfatase [Chloroflexota bacterium]
MRTLRHDRVALAVCALLALGAGTRSAPAEEPPGRQPNVLLVLVDAVRADHLGCYGYARNTSPNLDQFAREAMLFERCFSHAPATRASCSALHSGFLPHETKVLNTERMSEQVETLAEMLQRHGYRTAAVVCNYVLRRGQGFEQGFEIYDDTMNEHECVRGLAERIAEPVTDRAIALLEQLKDSEFFMWIHYQDPHGPYTPPDEHASMFLDPSLPPRPLKLNEGLSGLGGIPNYQQLGEHRDYHYYVSQYDGEIRYWDAQFGRLLQAVRKLGLYEHTLIILSSDHGEGMGERDLYFGHGENLDTSLTHVPLILSYGRALKGTREEYVQHNDIVPTILSTLNLPLDPRMSGRDLRAGQLEEADIVAAMGGKQWSIMRSGLKLICYGAPGRAHREFFDLRQDPHEVRNLADDPAFAKQADEMTRALKAVLKTDRLKIAPAPALKLTEEEKRKLRSLGYTR